jgi:hypothetical protein
MSTWKERFLDGYGAGPMRLVLKEDGHPFEIIPVTWGVDTVVFIDRARTITYVTEGQSDDGTWQAITKEQGPYAVATGHHIWKGAEIS